MAIEKTIIANYGDADLGKTSSILRVYEKLCAVVDNETTPEVIHSKEESDGDICAVLIIHGVKVGIASQGDPWSNQKCWLDDLLNAGCEIILAACRYTGATTKNIEDFAQNNNYTLYWTANARFYKATSGQRIAPNGIGNRFNDQWATEVANLIESWCWV